jgi:outer membrane protein TolC
MRTSWAVLSLVSLGLCAQPTLAHAESGPTVTLQSLLEAARRSHPTLAKQPLLAKSLELTRAKINRAYWPQLSLNGQATWQSDVTTIDVPVPGVNITPPSKDQYRVTLDLKQTIWDGGVASDQKRVAESRSRVQHEQSNVEWYQVRDSILQLYFAGVVQQDLEAQGEALEQHLEQVVEQARVALKSGVATERDVLLAQAKQLEARQASAEARSRLVGVRQSLHELTGAKLPQNGVLAAPPASCDAPQAPPAPGALRRPELDLLDAQAQVLDAQEQLDRSADNPRLGAFATGGYGRPGLNVLNDNFDFYFIGGVQLTVPLTYLYAGTGSNGREQLTVQRSLVARQREAVVKQVNLQLETQNTEIARLDAVVALDNELVGVRERARNQTELQLQLGTASMTDLISDLTQEDQARTQRSVHRALRDLACRQAALIRGDL